MDPGVSRADIRVRGPFVRIRGERGRSAGADGPERDKLTSGGARGLERSLVVSGHWVTSRLLLPWWIGLGAALSCAPEPTPAHQVRQQLLVIAEEDSSTTGWAYRMQGEGTAWSQVGAPIPVVFGRGGVGPKREGDGRSPEGVFRLGPAFGYAGGPPAGTRLPYVALDDAAVCVDDPDSPEYNQVLNPPADGTRFGSAEQMRRDLAHGDDLYEFGVVVAYNPRGERDESTGVGRGSCIFLHVWRSGQSPTQDARRCPRQPCWICSRGWIRLRSRPWRRGVARPWRGCRPHRSSRTRFREPAAHRVHERDARPPVPERPGPPAMATADGSLELATELAGPGLPPLACARRRAGPTTPRRSAPPRAPPGPRTAARSPCDALRRRHRPSRSDGACAGGPEQSGRPSPPRRPDHGSCTGCETPRRRRPCFETGPSDARRA